MSQTTITFKVRVNGVLTDVTSVVLSDPTGAYGVRRTDTGAVVVADGTAMVRQSAGTYTYAFTDPAPGLTYNYWVEFVYNGRTHHLEKNISGPAVPEDLSSYLTLAEAADLAYELPTLKGWDAASDDARFKALKQATKDIDAGLRYQGRRYDLDPAVQELEFPRIPYPQTAGYDLRAGAAVETGDEVWDWDDATDAAVVPESVKLACLHQADSILKADRDERMDARHDGVNSQSADGLSESYGGASPVLCRKATS